ncbi:MAG: alpha/beta hydrolase [Euryarchaeota archaeon]|nr:alpha/beta hydrolase [Euryarchaeota archaeon]
MPGNTHNVAKTYITGSVVSKDGTTIGYRQLGSGQGIILLHGGANASQNYSKLGAALSDTFTVYVPDRRGRGLSGPFGNDYGMHKEVEDVDALIKKTDAHYIFGLSTGALIALKAALELPSIHKAALYELPLDVDNSILTMLSSFMPRFDREIAEGKVAEAMVTLLKDFGGVFLPGYLQPLVAITPRFVLVRLFTGLLRRDAEHVKGDDVPIRALIPTFHFDYQLVVEMSGTLETFKTVCAHVLLLGGSASPSFLKHTLDALNSVLPNVERVELPGLGHGAALDGGKPKRVAQELRSFFL